MSKKTTKWEAWEKHSKMLEEKEVVEEKAKARIKRKSRALAKEINESMARKFAGFSDRRSFSFYAVMITREDGTERIYEGLHAKRKDAVACKNSLTIPATVQKLQCAVEVTISPA